MRAVDFETVLSGISCAADDDFLIAGVDGLASVEGEFAAPDAEHIFYDVFGFRSLHGNLAVIVRAVVEVDVEALHVLAHPIHVLVDVGCVDDKEEVALAHAVDEQVVDGAAVGVAHHAIEDFSVCGTGDVIGEDVVDIALGILALDAHLAHVGDVEDTAVLAHGVVLFDDGGILDGHVESTEWGNQRP